MSKYHNKKTLVDGILFDSAMEARYYQHLQELKEQGIVKGFTLQPVYLLLPAFPKLGKTVRKMEYKADFYVEYESGETAVIDVKGQVTEVFKVKSKLFDYYYPKLELRLVTWYRGEWILVKDKPKKGGARGTRKGKLLPQKRKARTVRKLRVPAE